MRIAEILVRPYTLPLRRPLRTAWGTLRSREGFAVGMRDGEGRWGWGEAAPLPGFGMESLTACRERLEHWRRRLPGSVLSEEGGDGAADPAWGLAEDIRGAGGHPAAAHGLELALLDLTARRREMPLARLLNPEALDAVPVNGTLGADPPPAAARRARELAAAGFRTLKVKVGADDPAADVARLKAVRQAAGSGMGIRIDANEAWTPDEALRALEALAPFRIEYAEQPVARGNLAAMARLAGASPIPIAADEAALSEAGARRVLEAGAAQVLILKPMALGGPVAAQRVARLAAAHGARVVITTTIDGAIGRAGALHTAAAVLPLTGGAVPACGLATGDLLAEDLLKDSIEPMDGAMRIPRAPGIGLQGADGALAEARS